MCGIAGVFAPLAETHRIQTINQQQQHRGPDADGVWSDGMVTLGHRRLAIIDLSEAGKQPMTNDARTLWITFNGEIYNFQALRRELESAGYGFRTRTDTEVILHAYDRWGTDCVNRLRGMFAFGLWDQRRQRLLLARDRTGKKPLFYTQVGERFWFASELQGLMANEAIPRGINLEAVDDYLSLGYVPAPLTGFKNVAKLPPAHWMTVERQGGKFVTRVERYWQLKYGAKLALSETEACEALREKLIEAVRLRMISDVPLGAFLSGGIDSSVIVGLMAQLSAHPIKTFSIGFPEASFDETAHARRIAEKWKTEHHEFRVEANALEILPKLVRHYGEPYADSSAVPTFYVAQLTRQHVTVALNGDGGDESFAGYERYWAGRMSERLQSVPGSRWALRAVNALLPDSIDPKNRLRSAKRFLTVASQTLAERYGRWVGYFDETEKRQLYASDWHWKPREAWFEKLFAETAQLKPPLDSVDAAMAVDVQSYLPYDLLVKVDIATMANSLEARSPLLDHEVMEFAARLPVQMKLSRRNAKYLLKKAFADLLPPENVNRRKMGFGVPIATWFRGGLKDLLRDTLLARDARINEFLQPAIIERLVTQHLNGQADHAFKLWNLLMLELWRREYSV